MPILLVNLIATFLDCESFKGTAYGKSIMRETKYGLSLPLAIAIGVVLVTAASAGSALAAANATSASNMTKTGGATAGNGSAGAKNATSSRIPVANPAGLNSPSNPQAKIDQSLKELLGGKK